jgi:hypothetical protein
MQDFLNAHPAGTALFFNIVGLLLNIIISYLVGREVLKVLAPKTRVWVAATVAVLVSILYLWFVAALVFVDLYAIAVDLGAWGATAASMDLLGYLAALVLFVAGIITEIVIAERTRRFLNNKALPWGSTIWHMIRLPIIMYALFFVVLVCARIPAVSTGQRTADAVNYIQSQHITVADVMGTHVPPAPYAPENDATVAGVDKNDNGIRDDVELAILKKYANSAKIRAAELQYALALQLMITQVFNSDTWKAAAQEVSRSYACVGTSVPQSASINTDLKIIDSRIKEVEDLVFNNQSRKAAQDQAYNFTTSYADLPGQSCDIDLNSLPN